MKGYLRLPKKLKTNISRFRIFDIVTILFFLNLIAVALVAIYIKKISTLNLPDSKVSYIKISSVPGSQDSDSVSSTAEAFVVYDIESRSIVAGKNQNLRFTPASTAKIMTAIIALEHYKIDDYLTIPNVYQVEGSKMNLVPGEQLSVKNLLYGMLLPSGNDAAYTLAYYYPGGVVEFVSKMNKKAEDLKLYNTQFYDPAGYEDVNFTTAVELARLASFAMENPIFKEIVATRYIEITDKNQIHKYYLENLNELLAYDNVKGIKTGFTNEAGGVLVTAVEKNGKILIVVVLKSQDRFLDTEDLMQFINQKVNYSLP